MKKTIIALCALCFSTTLTNAQDFKMGLKAGANFTKIDGKALKDEYKLNYHAGVFFEIELNKKIGLQPEVLLSQTKVETNIVLNPLGQELPNSSAKLNYLSIPILFKYKIGKVVVLNIGPQYSILLNNDATFWGGAQKTFKDGDFAMVGGVQFNFKYLRLYGRYNIGLNSINDISNSENWKSQQLQLGLGFRF